MENKSILITGGAGFIGSQFVRDAVSNDSYSRIYVMDKLTYAGDLNRIHLEIQHQNVEFIHDDINNANNYKSLFSEIDFLVHFAAESHVDRSINNGLPFLETNIIGTYNLFEAAREFPAIKSLLVSTDEVYGSLYTDIADENFNLNPASTYSASKASSELIALALHQTFKQNLCITRGCNTFGPFQDEEKLIPMAISRLIQGKKVPLYGDGSNIREWLYVSDHVSAISKILQLGKSGEIYNIGSNYRLSNLELIKLLLKILNLDESYIEFVEDRKGHDFRYALNSSKIRNQIVWEPKVDFLDGLKMTVDEVLKEKKIEKKL